MGRNKEAALRGGRLDEKHLTGKSNGFISVEYTHFPRPLQCKYCRSDYMRFSDNGICQRCQQHAEYVARERAETVSESDREVLR